MLWVCLNKVKYHILNSTIKKNIVNHIVQGLTINIFRDNLDLGLIGRQKVNFLAISNLKIYKITPLCGQTSR